MYEFVGFPKIARLSRECVVTEKIDGTNAQVNIRLVQPDGTLDIGYDIPVDAPEGPLFIRAGSRNRWLSCSDDSFGFAKWVHEHAYDLAQLGEGAHFGEWWGSGIQRNYSQTRKRFSLFNTHRWSELRPVCCDVVPVLYAGPLEDHGVMKGVKESLAWLAKEGSAAAPGFMKPEGIVIWHTAAQMYFKKTLDKDDEWKGKS